MSQISTSLALDCSFAGLSITLKTSAGATFTFSTPAARSSDFLPAELANIFEKSATTAQNLTHIYVTTGPGSFTGIRLGLATAEALKLVNPSLQIIGLSTLHALARQVISTHAPSANFTLVLDAAGSQAYTQTFTPEGIAVSVAACLSVAEAATASNLYAQSTLMLPATSLDALDTLHLFTLAEDSANHLPLTPVYLKPLTYKLAP